MALLKYFASIFVMLPLLISCGQSNELNVEPTAERPQMRAQLAIKHLNDSANDEAGWSAILTRIQSESRSGIFGWPDFWQGLKAAEFYAKLPLAKQRQILDLHGLDCGFDAFKAFGAFVLKSSSPISYLNTAPDRKCSSPLGADLTAQVMHQLKKAKSPAAAAELFLVEYQRESSGNWLAASNELSARSWLLFASHLVSKGRADHFALLISAQSQINGRVPWLGEFTEKILGNSKILTDTIHQLSLKQVLELSSLVPVASKLDDQAKSKLLDLLASEFKPQEGSSKPVERWTAKLSELLLLRSLEDHLHAERRGDILGDLSWLESLHRRFEEDLNSDPELAKQFLSHTNRQSLDALWLSLRLLSLNDLATHKRIAEIANSEEEFFGLSRILRIRLKMHLLAFDGSSEHLNEFCQVLKEFSIDEKNISVEDFRKTLSEGSLPSGCYKIGSSAAALTKIPSFETNQFVQSFDSVLFSPFESIRIKANQVDFGLVDFSTERIHEKIPEIFQDPSADALAFPIIIGFKVQKSNAFFKEKGIYYFPFHLSYRPSNPGGPEDRAALQGFQGNSLFLDLAKPKDSKVPSFISQGGIGQQFEGPMVGGRADQSEWALADLQDWILNLQAGAGFQNPKSDDQPIFLSEPHIEKLRRLRDAAERVDGKIRLYVLPQYIKALPEEQRLKVAGIFQENLRTQADNSAEQEEFLRKVLAPMAANQMESIINKESKKNPLEVAPAFNFQKPFRIEQADYGEYGTPGDQGKKGLMEVKESQ